MGVERARLYVRRSADIAPTACSIVRYHARHATAQTRRLFRTGHSRPYGSQFPLCGFQMCASNTWRGSAGHVLGPADLGRTQAGEWGGALREKRPGVMSVRQCGNNGCGAAGKREDPEMVTQRFAALGRSDECGGHWISDAVDGYHRPAERASRSSPEGAAEKQTALGGMNPQSSIA